MQELMTTLKEYHQKEDRISFFERLIDIAPGLESYVRSQLRIAEQNSLIPAGLYSPEDVLDEVYLYVYEHFDEMPKDESGLRVMLFQLANDRLDTIIQEEVWRHDSLSLEAVLAEELRQLSEIPQMTTDADGDIVLVEELDDSEIEPQEPRVLLLEESFEDEIIGQTGLDGALIRGDQKLRQLLARIYTELPTQSRILFDLWTRGKLTVEEIARVRAIDVGQVKNILGQIRARFLSAMK
jgi:DNA-directed RNA polymerase specialized sigma24 family protein